jgi:hypothetical protein
MRAILARQLNEPPPPLRTQRAGISPRLEEAVFWALAKDPADRPPTAGAFVHAAREGSRSRALSAFFSMASGKADALLASSFATSLPRFQLSGSGPRTPIRDVESVFDPGASSATVPGPDTPTIRELPLLAGRPAPEWPSPRRDPEEKRPFSLTKLLLISAGVLLGCVFVTSGLGAIGFLLQNGGPSSALSPIATATSQPTTTPQPTATAAPSVILTASPISVTLSCGSHKGSQATVTLSNKGQDTAQWSASLQGPQIAVNPATGTLGPGKRQTVTLAGFSLAGPDRQGILQFTADGAGGVDTGSAAVSYTLQSCIRNNGGDTQSTQLVSAHSDGNGGKHGKKHEDD